METPSSSRRITRSQAAILANSASSNTNTTRKMEESEMGISKSRQRTVKQDRSVLIDITNDSPIVGLASGSLKETPISSVSKQRSNTNCCKKTPGSGEALLRGQVKNLLQKVEEEAVISKFCFQSSGPSRNAVGFKAVFNSPACLAAPTPVNTPQVLNFSIAEELDSLSSVSQSPIEDHLTLPQVISGTIDGKKQEEGDSDHQKDLMISRELFLEFSEKSDSSSECSSVVTYQGTIGGESETHEKLASIEDDDASIWSIQVNASTRDDDEDEDEVNQENVEEDEDDFVVVGDDEFYDEDGLEEEEDVSYLDELCEGISNMNVDEEKKGMFMGKHVRFVYNSDDELVEEYEESDSADVLRLKGLPTPKGKHVRFEDEDED